MMLLLQAPANTANFMILGFGVILGTMAIFLVSLVIRFRNLNRDLMLLEEIEPDQ
jgi:hypothetical protein